MLRKPSVQGLLFLAALLGLWELAAAVGWIRPFRLPPPSRIGAALWELTVAGFPQGVRITTHFLATLRRTVEGFLVAMTLAIPLGLAIGTLPVLEALSFPIITFGMSLGSLSILPLVIVWFGIGETSKVVLIAYGCFWLMLSNSIAAVKYVDPVLIQSARTMDVSGLRLFRQVVLPAAAPRLFAGARISLGLAFMVIVGAEMVGTVQGLGALIMEARTLYRIDITIVGMAVLGMAGYALTTGLARAERILLPWDTGPKDLRR